MSETTDALKEKFRTAEKVASDPTIPASEAASQVLNSIRKEYATAANYAESRKNRKTAVSKRLQEERKHHNFKQQEVATKTGINVVTLSGYEIGKNEPNMEALVRLANLYDVTLDYLMCRTDLGAAGLAAQANLSETETSRDPAD